MSTTTRYERIRARGKDKPETLRQAQTWETVKNRYRTAGLCSGCASQAAWGHQSGLANIAPPCPVCATVVAAFPAEAVGPWRTLSQSRRKPSLLAHAPRSGTSRVSQLPPADKEDSAA